MYVHLRMGNGSANRTIWKYDLQVVDEQVIELPRGAEFLHVGDQDRINLRTLQLWALVDPDAEREPRRFLIHGTGHPVAPSLHASAHIGTVITLGGQLVWHVFDGGAA